MNLWLFASAGFPSLSFPLAFHKALSRGRVDLQKSQTGFSLFLCFCWCLFVLHHFSISPCHLMKSSLQVPSSPSEPDPLMWSDGVKTLGCYMAAKVPKNWWTQHGSWPKNYVDICWRWLILFPHVFSFFERSSCLGFERPWGICLRRINPCHHHQRYWAVQRLSSMLTWRRRIKPLTNGARSASSTILQSRDAKLLKGKCTIEMDPANQCESHEDKQYAKVQNRLPENSGRFATGCAAKQVGLGSPLPLPDADTDLSQEFWALPTATESCFLDVNLHPTQWWTMEQSSLVDEGFHWVS